MTAQLVAIIIGTVGGDSVFGVAALNAPTSSAAAIATSIGLAWVTICGRAIRAGVLVRTDDIVVRNVTRSYTLRRSAVAGFYVGRWHFFPYCCMVELRSGKRIP